MKSQWGGRKRTGRYDVLEEVKQVGHGGESDWPCQMLLPTKKRKDRTADHWTLHMEIVTA